MHLKRLFLQSVFTLILSLTAFTALSFAAANDYTVEGGNPVALPDVGDTGVALGTVTITDAGGDDFANDPEDLEFTINTTDYPNVIFDDSVTGVTVAGTCLYDTDDSVTYSASDTVVTIAISGGTDCADGETITIAGLQVKTTYVASAPGAAALFDVDNGTTADGSPVETSDTVNLAVAVGDLTSTNVEPDNLVISQTTTNTISFTSTADIPNLGVIKVTWPAAYDVSDANGRTAGDLSGMDGTWTASVSGQTVTFTQTGGTATEAGAISFSIDQIVNPDSTGTTGAYTILTEIAAGNDVETDAAVSADIIVGGNQDDDLIFGNVTDFEVSGDADGVVLTWTDPSGDDSTHIQVLRGVAPAPVDGAGYATVIKGTETYTDTDVEEGDVITYRLRAVTGADYGDLTEEVTITVAAPGEGDEPEEDTPEEDTPEDDDSNEDQNTDLDDINNHWAEEEIEFMEDEGIVEGNPDGTFMPDSSMNRAEAAALIHRILGLAEPDMPEMDPFTDVPKAEWYAGYVADLKEMGVISGNPDGTFEPGEFINRAEFLQMVMNAYDETFDYDVDSETDRYEDLLTNMWYAETVAKATNLGIVQGSECDGGFCFNAENSITRAEGTRMLFTAYAGELGYEMVVTLDEQNDSGQSGTLTITETDGRVHLVVSTTGGPVDVDQPMHVHYGTCADIGGVYYDLAAVVNGESSTTLPVTFSQLWMETALAVNIHKSAEESSVYYACGDLM